MAVRKRLVLAIVLACVGVVLAVGGAVLNWYGVPTIIRSQVDSVRARARTYAQSPVTLSDGAIKRQQQWHLS